MSDYQSMPKKTQVFDAFRSLFKIGMLENFLVKIKAGKKINSLAYRLIPRVYTYSPGTWKYIDRDGIKMKLDISNYVDHAKFFSISDTGFERLKKLVKHDWIIFDVGANIGATVLTFSTLASKGRVLGFEPNSRSFARLNENISLNNRNNISVYNVGLGDKEEVVQLFVVDETNPGMNRILNETMVDVKNLKSETITIKVLDDFISKENLPKVDLIKIDVEGFEYKVLTGAKQILTVFKPVLFIEINNDNISQNGSSAKELVTTLLQLGYNVYIAEPWEQINGNYNFDHCHFDILCVHSDRVSILN